MFHDILSLSKNLLQSQASKLVLIRRRNKNNVYYCYCLSCLENKHAFYRLGVFFWSSINITLILQYNFKKNESYIEHRNFQFYNDPFLRLCYT